MSVEFAPYADTYDRPLPESLGISGDVDRGTYFLARPIDEFTASIRDELGEGAGASFERAAAARTLVERPTP